MYCNMLAFSFAIKPAKSKSPNPSDSRTLFATVIFGAGAIVGWPFSILASFPFVFEELFVRSGDKVADSAVGKWIADRWIRIVGSVVLTSFLFVGTSALTRSFSKSTTDSCHWAGHSCLRNFHKYHMEYSQVQSIRWSRAWPRFVWHGAMAFLPSEPHPQLQCATSTCVIVLASTLDYTYNGLHKTRGQKAYRARILPLLETGEVLELDEAAQ